MVTFWAGDLDYRLAILILTDTWCQFPLFLEGSDNSRVPIKTFRDPKRIFYTTQVMTLMTPCWLSGLPTAPVG
jgi:hypothetical protein